MLVADPAQRFLDLPAEEHLLERLVPPLGEVAGRDRASRSGTAKIDEHIAEDREEPIPKRSDLRVESIACPPSSQEGVLYGLLGHPRILERSQRKSVELSRVRGVGLADVGFTRKRSLSHLESAVLGARKSPS